MQASSADIVIALDVDGVLLDFDEHFRRCAERCLGRNIYRATESYSLTKRFQITEEEKALVWKQFMADGWMATVPVYPSAQQMVNALRDLGTSLWAVTSVDQRMYADRCWSLRDLIPPDRVICVGDPITRPSKLAAYQQIGAHFVLDDLVVHVEEAKDVITYPVLMDLHYAEFVDTRPRYVVETHDEFVQLVKTAQVTVS